MSRRKRPPNFWIVVWVCLITANYCSCERNNATSDERQCAQVRKHAYLQSPSTKLCKATCINLSAKKENFAIAFDERDGVCCFSYKIGICHSANDTSISNMDELTILAHSDTSCIRGSHRFRNVDQYLYANFKISSVEKIRGGEGCTNDDTSGCTTLTFVISPCNDQGFTQTVQESNSPSDLPEASTQGSMTNDHDKITEAYTETLNVLTETTEALNSGQEQNLSKALSMCSKNHTEDPQTCLASFFGDVRSLASKVKENQTKSLAFSTTTIQYIRLPDISFWSQFATFESAARSQLLGFFSLPRFNRVKRSLEPVLVYFVELDLPLVDWIPLYPRLPERQGSSWHLSNNSQYYPTSRAPFVRIMVDTIADGLPLPVGRKFEINMKVNTINEIEVPVALYNTYRSWFKILSHGFECLQMNLTNNEGFSAHGCSSVTEGHVVTCSCDSLGLYTTVPRVVAQLYPSGLSLIFTIGLIVGMTLLVVTILCLRRLMQKIKCDRIVVQINLILALIALHFVVLIESYASQNKNACIAAKFLTHYFLLATGCFAVVESITIFSNLHTRSLRYKRLHPKSLMAVQLFAGWCFPLIIAAVAMGTGLTADDYVAFGQYGYDRCWFPTGSVNHLAAVIIPLGIFFTLVGFTALLSALFIRKAKKAFRNETSTVTDYDVMTVKDVDLDHVIRMLLEHIGVSILLLVPWTLFFIFAATKLDDGLPRIYSTFLPISIQGLLVFIIYFATSPETRGCFGRESTYSTRFNLYWLGPKNENGVVQLTKLSASNETNLEN